MLVLGTLKVDWKFSLAIVVSSLVTTGWKPFASAVYSTNLVLPSGSTIE